jgi:hypothetical protein
MDNPKYIYIRNVPSLDCPHSNFGTANMPEKALLIGRTFKIGHICNNGDFSVDVGGLPGKFFPDFRGGKECKVCQDWDIVLLEYNIRPPEIEILA